VTWVFSDMTDVRLVLFIFLSLIIPVFTWADRKCPNCEYLNLHSRRYCTLCSTDISQINDVKATKGLFGWTKKSTVSNPDGGDLDSLSDQSSSLGGKINLWIQEKFSQIKAFGWPVWAFLFGALAFFFFKPLWDKLKWNRQWARTVKQFEEDQLKKKAEYKKQFAATRASHLPNEILGVRQGASFKEVSKAYRKLAKQNHPDKYIKAPENIKAFIEDKMAKINWAYNELRKKKV